MMTISGRQCSLRSSENMVYRMNIPQQDIHPATKPIEPVLTLRNHDKSREPQRKIRILLVITRLTTGGDTNVVLDIANYFHNHPDFEAHLAVGPVPNVEVDLTHWAYERAIPTKEIPMLVNHIKPLTNLRAILQLR